MDYCRKYPEAAAALQEWYYEMLRSNFRSFNDLKRVYSNANLIGDDRVIFNIMGNNFRLVVRVSFDYKAVQIKWFGTHAEYDRIDVKKIKFKKN